MKKIRKRNPVDLQDREGFLDFLRQNARAGLEAVKVTQSYTVFRSTETPPREYTLRFCPENLEWPVKKVPGNLCRVDNGVVILPAQSGETPEPERDWEKQVTERYGDFTCHRGVNSVLSWLGALIVLGTILIRFRVLRSLAEVSGEFAAAYASYLALDALVIALLVFLLLTFALQVFEVVLDRLQLRAMQAALAEGRPYRTEDGVAKAVRARNLLRPLVLPLSLAVLAACLAGSFFS